MKKLLIIILAISTVSAIDLIAQQIDTLVLSLSTKNDNYRYKMSTGLRNTPYEKAHFKLKGVPNDTDTFMISVLDLL